jgi:phosphoheptose isomerase
VEPIAHLRELSAAVAKTAAAQVREAKSRVRSTLTGSRTLFFAGNGGSASDNAQQISTDYTTRVMRTRCVDRAIALTSDASTCSAAQRHFSLGEACGRHQTGSMRGGSISIMHATSALSVGCIRAAEVAYRRWMTSLVLTANDAAWLKGNANSWRTPHRPE